MSAEMDRTFSTASFVTEFLGVTQAPSEWETGTQLRFLLLMKLYGHESDS